MNTNRRYSLVDIIQDLLVATDNVRREHGCRWTGDGFDGMTAEEIYNYLTDTIGYNTTLRTVYLALEDPRFAWFHRTNDENMRFYITEEYLAHGRIPSFNHTNKRKYRELSRTRSLINKIKNREREYSLR